MFTVAGDGSLLYANKNVKPAGDMYLYIMNFAFYV